jgi:chromate reductase
MSKIVIIAGSNNNNLKVANEFQNYFVEKNTESQIIDLVSLELPLYSSLEETRGFPEKILTYKQIISEAQGLVFIVPEYNGGVPPVVTNFIAWISRSDKDWRACFNGKTAALASFSGSGGQLALTSLRNQLAYIGLNTIGRQLRATYKEDLNTDEVWAVGDLLLRSLN